MIQKSALFPDKFNANPYTIVLRNIDEGYGNTETHVVEVDEARGTCRKEVHISIVRNSHGTDCDFFHDTSDAMCPDEMASELQKKYGPKELGDSTIPRLRDAGRAWKQVASAGQEVICAHMPGFSVKALRYACANTALFACTDADGKNCVIKLMGVSRRETVAEQLHRTDKDTWAACGMVPVWQFKRIPLSGGEEILAVVMPELSAIRKGGYHFERLNEGKPSEHTIWDVVPIGIELAKSLGALHERGLVHNDVKPENIFEEQKGLQIKRYLGDMDSLQFVADQYQGRIHGTKAYMAPELLRHEPFSYASDVYSWGITMIALFDDLPPRYVFRQSDGIIEEVVDKRSNFYDQNRRRRDEANIRFYEIIEKAIQPYPEQRYPSAVELLAALEEERQRQRNEWETQRDGIRPPRKTYAALLDEKQDRELKLGRYVYAKYDWMSSDAKHRLLTIAKGAVDALHQMNIALPKQPNDPEAEIKTLLAMAKTVGQAFVNHGVPFMENGVSVFSATVKLCYTKDYDIICLYFQQCIDELYQAGVRQSVSYRITLTMNDALFRKRLEEINGMYPQYEIVVER